MTRRYRPDIQGCTEWSCIYHGEELRRLAQIHKHCTMDSVTGLVEHKCQV